MAHVPATQPPLILTVLTLSTHPLTDIMPARKTASKAHNKGRSSKAGSKIPQPQSLGPKQEQPPQPAKTKTKGVKQPGAARATLGVVEVAVEVTEAEVLVELAELELEVRVAETLVVDLDGTDRIGLRAEVMPFTMPPSSPPSDDVVEVAFALPALLDLSPSSPL